jgi:hypothetical protein
MPCEISRQTFAAPTSPHPASGHAPLRAIGAATIDHPATSLGPRCAIAIRPSANFFQKESRHGGPARACQPPRPPRRGRFGTDAAIRIPTNRKSVFRLTQAGTACFDAPAENHLHERACARAGAGAGACGGCHE